MKNTKPKAIKIPFSFGRFIASAIGHTLLFSAFIGMMYLADSTMLVYDFLFTASVIAGLLMGLYHANYANPEDIQK